MASNESDTNGLVGGSSVNTPGENSGVVQQLQPVEQPRQVSDFDPELTQDISLPATLDCTSKANSKYMTACISSGLTSNPFANIAERSKFSENQRVLENNLTAMQLHDSFSEIERTPPAKRQRAVLHSPTISKVGDVANINLDNVDNTNSNTKHVSFSPMLQEEPMVQGPPNNPIYNVIESAVPAWKSSTSHLGLSQKANLRYLYLRQQLDSDRFPSWTYGLEKLPSYFTPMSTQMVALAKTHARAVGELAAAELIKTVNEEQKLADDHMQLTKMMYTHVKNPDITKAEERQAQVVTGYRATESKKLASYAKRETKRRPTKDSDLKLLLANRVARIDQIEADAARRSGSASRSPSDEREKKRKKKGQKSKYTRGPNPNQKNRAGPSTSNGDAAATAVPTTSKGKAHGFME